MLARLLQRRNFQAVTICSALVYGRCTAEAAELFGFDDTAMTAFAGATVALGLVVVLKNIAKEIEPSFGPESSNTVV